MKRLELVRSFGTYLAVTAAAVAMVACAGYKAPVVDQKTGDFKLPTPKVDITKNMEQKDVAVLSISDATPVIEAIKVSSPEEVANLVNENPLVAMITLSVKAQESTDGSEASGKRQIDGTLTILNSDNNKVELKSQGSLLGVATVQDANPGITILLDFKSETVNLLSVRLDGEAILAEDGTAMYVGSIVLDKQASKDSLMTGGFEEVVKAEDSLTTEVSLGKFQMPLCQLSTATFTIGETTVNCSERN